MCHPQKTKQPMGNKQNRPASCPGILDGCKEGADRDREAVAPVSMRPSRKPEDHGITAAQTRAWSAAQIAQRQPEGLARTAEVREVDEENRTVELSFSSETAVRRFFGDEVLSHADGAMRTARLDASAPLLMNHDWDDQIGVVESHEIRDRKGRVTVRFSRSARGEEMWQDVVDGIRRNVSVGYSIHGVKVEEREGQPDLVTVTDWEPLEISLAAVAADVSVGVGRSHQPENPPEEGAEGGAETESRTAQSERSKSHEAKPAMNERILRNAKGDLVRAKVDEDGKIVEELEVIEKAGEGERTAQRQGAEGEQARTRELLEMGAQYDARDLAQTAVQEGTSVDAFQRQLLDHLNGDDGAENGGSQQRSASGAGARGGRRSQALPDQGGNIGMSDGETRRYSFLRAVRALADPTNRRAQQAAAFEFECSEAAADQLNREVEGLVVPPDVLGRALNTSTDGTAAGDTGGHLIDTTLLTSSFIDLLRARTVMLQLGSGMAGLIGNVAIPKKTGGATGYWIGEDEDAPEDTMTLGQIGMNPKTVAALSELTRRMMMQTTMDAEALVRSDLATALALTIDRAGFYGTGSDHQPLGIVNYDGINAVELGTAGKPTYNEVVQMESEIAADNADVNSMAYVMNSGMRGTLKTTEKFAGTSGAPIWEGGNTVNGYRTEVTNQIQSNDLIFGNFADALIGMWGGLELTVDPYTHSSKGRLRIVAMQDVDFVLRREASFCLGRAAAG